MPAPLPARTGVADENWRLQMNKACYALNYKSDAASQAATRCRAENVLLLLASVLQPLAVYRNRGAGKKPSIDTNPTYQKATK